MMTMRMIVDDCVDSLTVFSGFINRIADKLPQLTDKSQGVNFFGHAVYNCIRSVCSKLKTTNCAGAQVSDSEFKGNCK